MNQKQSKNKRGTKQKQKRNKAGTKQNKIGTKQKQQRNKAETKEEPNQFGQLELKNILTIELTYKPKIQ